MIAAEASLQLELRPLPGVDGLGLLERVRRHVEAALADRPGLRLSLRPHPYRVPLQTSEESEIVRFLQEHTGAKPIGVPFYTEGPLFGATGADIVVCGPGEIAQAHTRDEWVALAELTRAEDLYREAIGRFCS